MTRIDPALLATCISGRWHPAIGDPTLLGWATVAAYALAALLCLRAALRRRDDRRFWLGLCVLLAALTVNKQLDLQSALTAFGRCIASLEGWYDRRRAVQAAVILGILALAAAAFAILLWRMRRALARIGVALAGIALLLAFVAIRAVGFHHVDALIDLAPGGIRLNWLFELSGIALIAANAAMVRRRPAIPRQAPARTAA